MHDIDPELLAQLEGDAQGEDAPVDITQALGPGIGDLGGAAKRYEQLKVQKDQLNEELKVVNAAMKELEVNVIPDLMVKAGISNGTKGSFTTESGGRISLRNEIHPGVVAADTPKLHEWLRDTNAQSLIKETVNPASLKSHLRELIKQGQKLPEFVKVHTETKAVLTRSNKKEN